MPEKVKYAKPNNRWMAMGHLSATMVGARRFNAAAAASSSRLSRNHRVIRFRAFRVVSAAVGSTDGAVSSSSSSSGAPPPPPQVAVLGGGAAGLTAAYFAATAGARVTVYERNSETGKKILMSGGARCNVLPVSASANDFITESTPR